MATKPILVIVGETASGKSALAIELAERLSGEIICADSRTIYKDMDIGTAKPSPADRLRIPHHMLDVVTPDMRFTVVDFKREADHLIKDIHSRGKLPILVGGSGLYIDAVIYDYQFATPEEFSLRSGVNPRHLAKDESRAKQDVLRPGVAIVGLQIDRDELRQRVADRVENMVQAGFVQEVTDVSNKYGWDVPALMAPGYRAFREYIEGTISIEEAKAKFVKSDMDLAKRQRTWFKRNKSIQWVDNPRKAVAIATTLLSKIQ